MTSRISSLKKRDTKGPWLGKHVAQRRVKTVNDKSKEAEVKPHSYATNIFKSLQCVGYYARHWVIQWWTKYSLWPHREAEVVNKHWKTNIYINIYILNLLQILCKKRSNIKETHFRLGGEGMSLSEKVSFKLWLCEVSGEETRLREDVNVCETDRCSRKQRKLICLEQHE